MQDKHWAGFTNSINLRVRVHFDKNLSIVVRTDENLKTTLILNNTDKLSLHLYKRKHDNYDDVSHLISDCDSLYNIARLVT